MTLQIPDAVAPRVLAGYAAYHGYTPKLPDGTDNPETRAQFVRRKVAEHVKGVVREHEAAAARANADAAAESEISVT